jgi:fructose-specific phosphotransferase system component IIB
LTVVDIAITRDSFEEMEKLIEMGFKDGITATMQILDKIFEARK